MSNVEQLPPTSGIADPQVRTFLDSFSNAWQLRNGNIGATEDDRFITKGEFNSLTKKAINDLVSAETGAVNNTSTFWPVPGQQGTIIDALTSAIVGSPLWDLLGKRIEDIVIPDEKVRALENKLFVETRERVTAIQAEATNRANDLLAEALSRTNGDQALQSQIDVLAAASTGDLADLIAAIETETTARIAGDAAEAAARQTLAAQMRGDYTGTDPNQLVTGLLYSERVARVDADGALSSQITALSSTVSNNYSTLNAAITSEQVTRAGADTALASDLSALTATVNTNYNTLDAAIIEERSVRANADSANASAISGLSSTVTNNNNTLTARISTEETTRANADTATTNSLNALTSRVGATESGITSEATTRSNKDNALAGVINTLWAIIDDDGSGSIIQDGALAAVSPVAATATRWQAVRAAVTDPNTGQVSSTSIKQDLISYANAANGTMNSSYTVRIETAWGGGSVVSGFGLMTTNGAGSGQGPTSSFGVRADQFWIGSPQTYYDPSYHNENNWNVPFIVTTGPTYVNGVVQPAGVYMKKAAIAYASIDTARIADLTVTNAKIQDAAITNAKIGYAAVDTLKIAGEAVFVPRFLSGASGWQYGAWYQEFDCINSTFHIPNLPEGEWFQAVCMTTVLVQKNIAEGVGIHFRTYINGNLISERGTGLGDPATLSSYNMGWVHGGYNTVRVAILQVSGYYEYSPIHGSAEFICMAGKR